jgi:hypothetical protein
VVPPVGVSVHTRYGSCAFPKERLKSEATCIWKNEKKKKKKDKKEKKKKKKKKKRKPLC